mgnify:CR=1 FL=1
MELDQTFKGMHTGQRVLVVDDEEVIRRVLSDILSGCGLLVETAVSGEDALRLLQAERFDLTLTDRNMPGMGGRELALIIQGRFPEHRVIMMSGVVQTDLADDPGCIAGFLTKPFSRASVLDSVGKVLGRVLG